MEELTPGNPTPPEPAQQEQAQQERTQPEHTADGRYVVINGRRWRATDPDIPQDVAARLRRILMAARRDVGAALRAGDEEAEARARSRVHAAKVALGERGTPWWEQDAGERRERWESGLVEPEG